MALRIFSPLWGPALPLGLLAAAALVVACAADGVGEGGSFAETANACSECQTILVECSSTSTDETQFVECRDQWQACQQGKGLTPEMCGNPKDADACKLCATRATKCVSDGGEQATCDQEFSVCKAFLITRTDLEKSCTTAGSDITPEAACTICQKDFAVCLSDTATASALAVCSTKRETCLTTHGTTASVCAIPSGAAACTLCTDHHKDCAASAGPNCDAGFAQCTGAIAASVSCELSQGEGGMGEGGMGQGGGGTSCAHDECVAGDALVATCSPCAGDVCAQDNWCCDNEWDTVCIDIAKTKSSCGCT